MYGNAKMIPAESILGIWGDGDKGKLKYEIFETL
jgi:hypothetical protein